MQRFEVRRRFKGVLFLVGLTAALLHPEAQASGIAPALPVSQQIVAQALGVPPAQLPKGRVLPRNNILAAIQIVVRLSGQSAEQVYADFVSSVVGYCRGQSSYPVNCDSIMGQAEQNSTRFVIQ